MLEIALAYARERWPVFPVTQEKKVPLISDWKRRSTVNPVQLRKWWAEHPEANVATPTGIDGCGYDVLDIDSADGEETIQTALTLGVLTDAEILGQAITGRGRHLFIAPNPERRSSVKRRPGVDIKASGGFVVLPGSIHESGHVYRWDRQPSGWPDPVEEPTTLDNWWTLDLEPPAARPLAAVTNATSEPTAADRTWALNRRRTRLAEVAATAEGRRRTTLNNAAFEIGRLAASRYLPHAESRTLLYTAAAECGLMKKEATETIERAMADAAAKPWTPGISAARAAALLPGILAARDLDPTRWGGRTGGSDYAVLGVLLDKARETGYTVNLLVPMRTIAKKANVSLQTAQNATRRLIEDGWVEKTDPRGEYRSCAYGLLTHGEAEIPVSAETLREIRRSMDIIGEPVFCSGNGLGKAAARVFGLLSESTTPRTAAEIAETLGLSIGTVRKKVRVLTAFGLLESTSAGWRSSEHGTPEALDALGHDLGANAQVERRLERIDEWQRRWREARRVAAKQFHNTMREEYQADEEIAQWADLQEEAQGYMVNTQTGEIRVAS